MLKMPIPWFDVPKNNPGELAVRLASDCKKVNSLTTTLIGFAIQNTVLLSTSLILGFIFQWKLTLISLGLIPFMLLASMLQMTQQMGFNS